MDIDADLYENYSQENNSKSCVLLQVLLVSVALLFLFGIISILSAGSIAGLRMKVASPTLFFQRQLLWAMFALTAGLIASLLKFRYLLKFAPLMFVINIILLLLVFAPVIGGSFGGSHRWLRLGSFRIQPSEILKFTMPLFIAWIVTRQSKPFSNFKRGFLPAFLVVLLASGLVFIEPNISTSGIVAMLGFTLLFIAGAKLRHLIPLISILAILGLVFALAFFPHFRHRLFSFTGSGNSAGSYHAEQGLIALGNGGMTGVGLGNSVQKLGYLPEAYTDYIFAILGEEMGFIGAALIVIFFIALLWSGFLIALRTRNQAARLTATGIVLAISLEALINMAVVTHLIPTTGVALPFLSFGGSSLMINAVGIGVLVSIYRSEDFA